MEDEGWVLEDQNIREEELIAKEIPSQDSPVDGIIQGTPTQDSLAGRIIQGRQDREDLKGEPPDSQVGVHAGHPNPGQPSGGHHPEQAGQAGPEGEAT